MAYWTKNDEDPHVYHTDPDCSEGKKIESGNKEQGAAPVGYRKCEVCK
jgi:hypothetical protein